MLKEILLVVVFITSSGEEVLVDGWHPRKQPSMEICEERLAYLTSRIETVFKPVGLNKSIRSDIVDYNASCIYVSRKGRSLS